MKNCQHRWWDTSLRHNYRRCKYCFYTEYNYTGKWEARLTLEQFVNRHTPLDGHQFIPRIRIEACQLFEYQTYESWGAMIVAWVCGVEFSGPNLNSIDAQVRKHFGEQKPWDAWQEPETHRNAVEALIAAHRAEYDDLMERERAWQALRGKR